MRVLGLAYAIGLVALIYQLAKTYRPGMRVDTGFAAFFALVAISPLIAAKQLAELVDFLVSLAIYHLLGLVDQPRTP